MRTMFTGLLVGTLLLTPGYVSAQPVCDNPNSCAHLGCVKTCEDRWENGKCVGGYCPKGITPGPSQKSQPPSSGVELHLYNVSPDLELEIRKLIDKGM
jgi:hypothetical protein